jgi:hypothetical protein
MQGDHRVGQYHRRFRPLAGRNRQIDARHGRAIRDPDPAGLGLALGDGVHPPVGLGQEARFTRMDGVETAETPPEHLMTDLFQPVVLLGPSAAPLKPTQTIHSLGE